MDVHSDSRLGLYPSSFVEVTFKLGSDSILFIRRLFHVFRTHMSNSWGCHCSTSYPNQDVSWIVVVMRNDVWRAYIWTLRLLAASSTLRPASMRPDMMSVYSLFCGMLRGADARLFSPNRLLSVFTTEASVLPKAICRSSLKMAKSPPTKTCVHGNMVIIMNHH